MRRAGALVREHVSDPDAQSATVDRFLDELDAMAPSEAVIGDRATARLRSASRESLAALVGAVRRGGGRPRPDQLSSVADDLASVAKLLTRESVLTRHLADPADDPTPKVRLVETLLYGKVGDTALDVLKAAVSETLVVRSNLVDAVEHVARLALLVRPSAKSEVDEVEDQLFRFSRILDAQPRLTTLLSDYSAPAEGRVELLRNVLDSGSGSECHDGPAAFADGRAAARRARRRGGARSGRARGGPPRRGGRARQRRGRPQRAQRTRLTEVLTRIYGHPVSVQLHIDPELLGGLHIAVGDEVIDGTLSSKLAAAETQLPD